MRKFNPVTILCLLFVHQLVFGQELMVSPTYPEEGNPVAFTWKNRTKGSSPDSLHIELILLGDKVPVKKKVVLPATTGSNKNERIYEYVLENSSKSYAIGLSWEQNNGLPRTVKSAVFPMYQSGKPVRYAYGSMAGLYSVVGFGENTIDSTKAFDLLTKEKQFYPETFGRFIMSYAGLAKGNNKRIKEVRDWINKWLVQENISEEDYLKAQLAFNSLGDDKSADMVEKLIFVKFPFGTQRRREMLRLFSAVKNEQRLQGLLDSCLQRVTGNSAEAQSMRSFLYYQAALYGLKTNDALLYSRYIVDVAPQMASPTNKVFAQKLLKADTLIGYAEKFARDHVAAEKENFNTLKSGLSEQTSNANALTLAKQHYADAAMLYAAVLEKNKKTGIALDYAALAADTLFEGTDYGYNDTYLLLAKKHLQPKEALAKIESVIKRGYTSLMVKKMADALYTATNQTDTPFETWFANLTNKSDTKRREALEEQMLNKIAPTFSLLDMTGKQVSLADFRNKTVIIDFWATWCVPCLNSFPAMQKAVNQFARDSSVVFLFIDTRESGKDIDTKKQKSISFIKNKLSHFLFTYLFDTENEVISNYGVKTIPAKFVIDGNGIIRFATQGYYNNEEELVQEISLMIQIAKEKVKNN